MRRSAGLPIALFSILPYIIIALLTDGWMEWGIIQLSLIFSAVSTACIVGLYLLSRRKSIRPWSAAFCQLLLVIGLVPGFLLGIQEVVLGSYPIFGFYLGAIGLVPAILSAIAGHFIFVEERLGNNSDTPPEGMLS